ncbi:hypothetical protein J2Y69_002771 [Microbacterium resistens]|uniref:Uncharacterized protein n=1 Tax=Microbacterium resistens TaxID=156977 RepID=A0ABU1SEX1_9MICO|nr:hypothetical protein [Microbacterium resistens]MDR6868160.1 hypothetical protein [Microbacterium resistens]
MTDIYSPDNIARSRARAAEFRERVERGELDETYLEVAVEMEAYADEREQTAQKNAPGAVAAAGGEITTDSAGMEASMTNDTTTVDYTATDVAAALAEIDASEHGCIDLEPSDALYQDVAPSFKKPADWLGCAVGDAAGCMHMAHPVDQNGRKVEIPAGDWWQEQIAKHSTATLRYWKRNANAAIRVGELLAISLGMYLVAGERVEDGEPVVELITAAERRRRDRENERAWAAAHPEVMAAMPVWADDVSVGLDGVEGVELWFERHIGPVSLSRPARHVDGRLIFDDATSTPYVAIDRDNIEELTVDAMRELASSLMTAVGVIEGATLVEVGR